MVPCLIFESLELGKMVATLPNFESLELGKMVPCLILNISGVRENGSYPA